MTKPVRFVLLLMPGFSLLSLGGFLDKLRFSREVDDFSHQINCSWIITSLSSEPVPASSDVPITPDTRLEHLSITPDNCDYFIVFGGSSPSSVIATSQSYIPILKNLSRRKVRMVSMDNAAFLFAAAGLVNDEITLHWRHIHEFHAMFPEISVRSNSNVLLQPHLISCPGGSAAIELAAMLLERHLSKEISLRGLSDMLVSGFAPPSEIYWSKSDLSGMPDGLIRAMVTMKKHITEQLTADEIAQNAGLSRRQLDRLFMVKTGHSLHAYYINMKISLARWLLERTEIPLGNIARDTGFSSGGHLSRVFRQYTGMTPGQWRTLKRKENIED